MELKDPRQGPPGNDVGGKAGAPSGYYLPGMKIGRVEKNVGYKEKRMENGSRAKAVTY
jgi:hypothetical protein